MSAAVAVLLWALAALFVLLVLFVGSAAVTGLVLGIRDAVRDRRR